MTTDVAAVVAAVAGLHRASGEAVELDGVDWTEPDRPSATRDGRAPPSPGESGGTGTGDGNGDAKLATLPAWLAADRPLPAKESSPVKHAEGICLVLLMGWRHPGQKALSKAQSP